jgi:PAS domain-containing protein
MHDWAWCAAPHLPYIEKDRSDMIRHKRPEDERAQPMHNSIGATGHFRPIAELAPDAVVAANREGRIRLVNRQTEALFGYPQWDLLGQPIERLIPDRFRAAHEQHRAGYAAAPRTRPMGAALYLFGRCRSNREKCLQAGASDYLAKPVNTEQRLSSLRIWFHR